MVDYILDRAVVASYDTLPIVIKMFYSFQYLWSLYQYAMFM